MEATSMNLPWNLLKVKKSTRLNEYSIHDAMEEQKNYSFIFGGRGIAPPMTAGKVWTEYMHQN